MSCNVGGRTPVVRSDNGLIFQSKRFRKACGTYRLTREFITPYTPLQNGLIERFFRSLKEECVWQHSFKGFAHARGICDPGLNGTTLGDHIRRLAIKVLANTVRGSYQRWLEIGGVVQLFTTPASGVVASALLTVCWRVSKVRHAGVNTPNPHSRFIEPGFYSRQ